MTDETYNGWKNYPTWAVNLWLENDEPLYREALERTQAALEDPDALKYQNSRRLAVADMLKDWIEEMGVQVDSGHTYPVNGQLTGMSADLYGYALGCVDWLEIANAWIEEVQESVSV